MITLERLMECKKELETKGIDNFVIAVYSPLGVLNRTILDLTHIDLPKNKYFGFLIKKGIIFRTIIPAPIITFNVFVIFTILFLSLF